MNIKADIYLRNIINKNKVLPISINNFRLFGIKNIIKLWAKNCLNDIIKSGSSAKGTAVKGISDIDLFISLKHNTAGTLKEIYNSLDNFLKDKGISTKRQNVSIRISHSNLIIDLVPGKKQLGYTNYHSIYLSKKDTWEQTNVKTHIDIVSNSNRIKEIILTKIWKKIHGLEFPSIYLELIVIEALKNKSTKGLSDNFWTVLKYLTENFVEKVIVDPSNSNNIVSDLLHKYEKETIVIKAKESISKKYWSDIIW